MLLLYGSGAREIQTAVSVVWRLMVSVQTASFLETTVPLVGEQGWDLVHTPPDKGSGDMASLTIPPSPPPHIHMAVTGECGHQFHLHCIMKWLGTQQTNRQCPMCRRDWQFKQ